jgi:hypothetical protein
VDETSPAVPDRASVAGSDTERGIRFAVYLTGGLVLLAVGVFELSATLGQVLNCAFQTNFCSEGFSTGILYEEVPALGGAAFLLVVATVLFLKARREHG